MAVEAFSFDVETLSLRVVDQTKLPVRLVYVQLNNTCEGYEAIKKMWVRGAPCIAAVGCLSMIVELNKLESTYLRETSDLIKWLDERAAYLISSRPTAVNLKQALIRLLDIARAKKLLCVADVKHDLTHACIKAIETGKKANWDLGRHGALEIMLQGGGGSGDSNSKFRVLTHCNTGSLATVGHGTALAVIRELYRSGRLEMAYCTETRPYNQGSRLTAWELRTENIPSTLIADNMVAYLMQTKGLDAVVVGADRVTANGDTANKIGTLQIAVLAKHYGVPFYVAAPSQSIDLEMSSGDEMVIEERPADELRKIGPVQLAPVDMDVWNPCFDVTPAYLITAIITECGTVAPNRLRAFIDYHRNADMGYKHDALF